MTTLRILLAAIVTFAGVGASQAQICNVSAEKRALITAILCGQNSTEQAYRTQGSACVEKAFETRMLDTAKQVAVLRACGDREFAEKLRTGTLQSMRFIQALSTCSSESIDFVAIYARVEREVAARATMLACTPELGSVIAAQRQAIERKLEIALDPASARVIEQRFSIKVDDQGNVVDGSAK